MPSINRGIVRVAGFACDLFYRRSRLGGEVPASGPLILVANHPNGLVDPLLIALTTPRPVRFLGKAPLFAMPVIGGIMRGMQALPVYRAMDGADTDQNASTFRAVFDALADGDQICLFPEGISHSGPQLERLKTGAARMALGAEAAHGFRLGVRIVPIGLVYRAKGRFRSRVATWVGEPVGTSDLAELHGRDDRAAVVELTERIAGALRSVTLNVERWEDLPLLELAERIWPGEGRRVERMRRLAEGARRLRATSPERVDALRTRVSAFAERLERLGIQAKDLAVDYTPGRVVRFALVHLGGLLLGLPLAFVGTLLWWVPYRATRPVALLAKPSPEVLATSMLLASLVLFPAWLTLLGTLAALWGGWIAAAAVLLVAPVLGVFALTFWERRSRAVDDAQVFLRLGLRTRLKERLRAQRDELVRELEALGDELGARA